jgi:hypothetical protein
MDPHAEGPVMVFGSTPGTSFPLISTETEMSIQMTSTQLVMR